VIAIWVVALVVMMPLGSKLTDETRDDTASFPPESAESTRVVELLDSRFAPAQLLRRLGMRGRPRGQRSDPGRRRMWRDVTVARPSIGEGCAIAYHH